MKRQVDEAVIRQAIPNTTTDMERQKVVSMKQTLSTNGCLTGDRRKRISESRIKREQVKDTQVSG
jgi:hypothetical protein